MNENRRSRVRPHMRRGVFSWKYVFRTERTPDCPHRDLAEMVRGGQFRGDLYFGPKPLRVVLPNAERAS
jgi:hypothetical protein